MCAFCPNCWNRLETTGEDSPSSVRCAECGEVVGFMDGQPEPEASAQRWVEELGTGGQAERRRALRLLRQIGPSARHSLVPLITLLQSETLNDDDKPEVVRTIGEIAMATANAAQESSAENASMDSPSEEPAIINEAHDTANDNEVKIASLETVIEALRTVFRKSSQDVETRVAVVEAFGGLIDCALINQETLASSLSTIYGIFNDGLADEDHRFVEQVLKADLPSSGVDKYGDQIRERVLKVFFHTQNPRIRVRVIQLTDFLEFDMEEILSVLREGVLDPHEEVVNEAMTYIFEWKSQANSLWLFRCFGEMSATGRSALSNGLPGGSE